MLQDKKKNYPSITYLQSRNRDTDRTNISISSGRSSDRMNWETGINIRMVLYIKQITNENLLYSRRNYYPMLCGDLNGKEI